MIRIIMVLYVDSFRISLGPDWIISEYGARLLCCVNMYGDILPE